MHNAVIKSHLHEHPAPPPSGTWTEPLSPPQHTANLDILGIPDAGSLGVRGLITHVPGTSHAELVDATRQALAHLKEAGLRRVHILQPVGSELYWAGLEAGFAACPGETLFYNDLTESPLQQHECPETYQLRDGDVRDLLFIQSQLAEIPELAFQSWEVLSIGRGLDRTDRFFKIIEHQGEIVGISIGGSHGTRGTISHTWVAEGHRSHGLGQALSDASLQALYDGGARRIHLMTVANNTKAEHFWERQGFVRQVTETFLEIDV